MSAVPCDFGIDCRTLGDNTLDFPITNYSSEGPEQKTEYNGNVFANLWDKMGCLSLCTSTISQNAANLCALAQQAQCNPNPPCAPFCGPGNPATFFFNQSTSCSVICASGSTFTYFVPAGIFSGATQAVANALANAFACAQAATSCQPSNPGGVNPAGSFSLGSIPSGCLDAAYSQTIPSTRFVALWTINSGSLPPGLTLNATTGLISGTPTVAGFGSFVVRAFNEDGNYAERTYTFCVITISPATLLDPVVGVPYQPHTLSVNSTPCSTPDVLLAWQIASGFLPLGLTLNATTGVISGTATLDATYNFVVSVTSSTFSCRKAYTMTVFPCTNITNASPLPDADIGVAYSEQLNSIGIVSPVWSIIAGTLPTGLSMSAGGLISGTPTSTGAVNFTAQVTGTGGNCGKAFSLTVNAPFDCGATPASIQDAVWTNSGNDACHSFTMVAGVGAWNITYETVPSGPCQTFQVFVQSDICNPGADYLITVTIPWTDSGNIDPPPAEDLITFLLDIGGVQTLVSRALSVGPFTDVVLTGTLPGSSTSQVFIIIGMTTSPSPSVEAHGTVSITPLTPP